MLLHGIGHVLIDRQQDLFVAPVELLLVISAEQQKETYQQSMKNFFRNTAVTPFSTTNEYFATAK